MKSAIAGRAVFRRILYAQCWEDAHVLATALDLGPGDDVLSVASAGDNSLALLLAGPRSVVALDLSVPQLAVCELKVAGIRVLDYGDFLELLGARPSTRRRRLYRGLRPALSDSARGFWDSRADVLAGGLLGAGKFERYLGLFRDRVLPLIHSRRRIEALLEPRDRAGRVRFYDEVWDTRRWRGLFGVFFSRRLMGLLGRDPAFFAHVEGGSVAERILARTRYALTELPVADNWFLEFILRGRYADPGRAHPYLRPEGFARLKEERLTDRLRLVRDELEAYLPACRPGAFSAYNLSDVFEYMDSQTSGALYRAILRASRPGARLASWNLLVHRRAPAELEDRFVRHPERAAALHARDRAWFYERFVLETVKG